MPIEYCGTGVHIDHSPGNAVFEFVVVGCQSHRGVACFDELLADERGIRPTIGRCECPTGLYRAIGDYARIEVDVPHGAGRQVVVAQVQDATVVDRDCLAARQRCIAVQLQGATADGRRTLIAKRAGQGQRATARLGDTIVATDSTRQGERRVDNIRRQSTAKYHGSRDCSTGDAASHRDAVAERQAVRRTRNGEIAVIEREICRRYRRIERYRTRRSREHGFIAAGPLHILLSG